VLEEIKRRVGKNFPVQYRFGLKHYMKGLRSGALPGEKYVEAGRDVEEGLKMARILEGPDLTLFTWTPGATTVGIGSSSGISKVRLHGRYGGGSEEGC